MKALKTVEDWDVSQQLEGWNDQEMNQIYDQVVDLLTPKGVERDRSKVKIAHTDNVENGEEFLSFYSKLKELEPIKEIEGNISIYDVNGTLYATDCSEGMYAVMYYSK